MRLNELTALAKIDLMTAQDVSRNSSFLLSLTGALSQVIDSSDFNGTKGRSKYLLHTRDLTNQYIDQQTKFIQDNSVKIAEVAFENLKRDASEKNNIDHKYVNLTTHIDHFIADAVSSIASQAGRDFDKAHKALRDIAIQVDLIMQQRGWERSAALIAIREKQRTDLKFNFMDRLGKRWGSAIYTRALLRGHYLNLYNEVYLYMAAQLGRKEAFVTHEQKTHRHHHIKFSILPTPGDLPFYFDINKEIFHPNSRALASIVK